jgi:transposase-like protein
MNIANPLWGAPRIHGELLKIGIERIMKEIRRRTHVVEVFPDGQSCLNLAARLAIMANVGIPPFY